MFRDDGAAKSRYIYSGGGGITRLPSGLTSRSIWTPVEPFKRCVGHVTRGITQPFLTTFMSIVIYISRPLALAVLQDLFTKADKIQDDEPLHDFVERQATIFSSAFPLHNSI